MVDGTGVAMAVEVEEEEGTDEGVTTEVCVFCLCLFS